MSSYSRASYVKETTNLQEAFVQVHMDDKKNLEVSSICSASPLELSNWICSTVSKSKNLSTKTKKASSNPLPMSITAEFRGFGEPKHKEVKLCSVQFQAHEKECFVYNCLANGGNPNHLLFPSYILDLFNTPEIEFSYLMGSMSEDFVKRILKEELGVKTQYFKQVTSGETNEIVRVLSGQCQKVESSLIRGKTSRWTNQTLPEDYVLLLTMKSMASWHSISI